MTPTRVFVRWLLVFPGAVGCAWAAYFLITILNRASFLFVGLDPEGFMQKIFLNGMSGLGMGAALVMVGVQIAPSRKKPVAAALAVVGILFVGVCVAINILGPIFDGWAFLNAMAMLVGIGAVAYEFLVKGQIQEPLPSSLFVQKKTGTGDY